MSNCDIIQIVWETLSRDQNKYRNIHEFCGLAVENIMKLAFHKKTLDNITVVMIALEGLENYFSKIEQSRPTTQGSTQAYDSRKPKVASKLETSFERKYIGRSTSPSNYSSIRSRSFYRT